MPRIHRPRGPRRRPTTEWKRRALAEIEAQGTSISAVAADIGASKASVSNLLSETAAPATSRLIDPLSKRLRIPLPEWRDEEDEDTHRKWRILRRFNSAGFAAQKRALDRLVEAIIREHPEALRDDSN